MLNRPNPFNGLRHLALMVPNLEQCEHFYVEIMGMEVLRRASHDLVYLTSGNDNLSLERLKNDKTAGYQYLDHIGFLVAHKEDLEDWYQFMQAHNIPLLDKPHDHKDGARSFHCKDPAGNEVQALFHPALSGQRII